LTPHATPALKFEQQQPRHTSLFETVVRAAIANIASTAR